MKLEFLNNTCVICTKTRYIYKEFYKPISVSSNSLKTFLNKIVSRYIKFIATWIAFVYVLLRFERMFRENLLSSSDKDCFSL